MMTDKKLWRNRKERKEWARRLQSEDSGLEVVHPDAAGIDVGNGAHYVAVRPDRDPEPVRRFERSTADLHRLGGLVKELWSEDRGHAVDESVLDPYLRDSRRPWLRGVSGQCAAHQESAGTQERCAGEPVVAEIAHPWVVEQLVPTAFGDSCASYLLAATGRTCAWSGDVCSTYAESVDADERAVG